MTEMNKSVLIAFVLLATLSASAKAQDAQQILDTSGVQGGLVVVIGCDSPSLLAQLRVGESYLVHGLDGDPLKVASARDDLREHGLYGPVTVSRWDGSQLPFVDNLVNLVVLRDAGCEIREEEMMRVLAPGGVAVKLDSASRHLAPDTLSHKPWPAELDQWSHFLHDASNNAVSNDTKVGPAQGLRWTCGPEYARSHEHFSSVSAMVTAGGRVFYIIDEGPISSVYLSGDHHALAVLARNKSRHPLGAISLHPLQRRRRRTLRHDERPEPVGQSGG